jgi:RNA polymerase sigma-70 factor (ECF subfamily)
MGDISEKDMFVDAYLEYYPVIYSAVYASISNKDDADDICQEIFLIFYNKFDTIQNRRTWLHVTMKNVLGNYYRKKKSSKSDNVEDMDTAGIVYYNGFRDTRILIQEAIENIQCTDTEKNILDMIAVHRFTQEKTAELLGMSRRQIRYRMETVSKRIINYLKLKGINDIGELL